jgi:hypothetical protein
VLAGACLQLLVSLTTYLLLLAGTAAHLWPLDSFHCIFRTWWELGEGMMQVAGWGRWHLRRGAGTNTHNGAGCRARVATSGKGNSAHTHTQGCY